MNRWLWLSVLWFAGMMYALLLHQGSNAPMPFANFDKVVHAALFFGQFWLLAKVFLLRRRWYWLRAASGRKARSRHRGRPIGVMRRQTWPVRRQRCILPLGCRRRAPGSGRVGVKSVEMMLAKRRHRAYNAPSFGM